jgi:DNA-directed RNA polymerase subunit RPC12/RpoP
MRSVVEIKGDGGRMKNFWMEIWIECARCGAATRMVGRQSSDATIIQCARCRAKIGVGGNNGGGAKMQRALDRLSQALERFRPS